MSKKIEDEKDEQNRLFWQDLRNAVNVLYKLHYAFENYEPLSKSLTKETEEAIYLISNWKTNDKEMDNILDDVIGLLISQLEFSQKLEARKERLYKEYLKVLHGSNTTGRIGT